MGTTLGTLKAPAGARKKRKRVGRGPGSGSGTTAGRGQKGQGSRSGGKMNAWFEGGQMPLQRRLPKRGFKSPFRVDYAPVNVGRLAELYQPGDVVDAQSLKKKGVIPRSAKRWKLLAQGELKTKLTLQPDKYSTSARMKVESAGGTVA